MTNTRSSPLREAFRRILGMLFAPQIFLIVMGVVAAYLLFVFGEFAGLRALDVHINDSALAFIVGFIVATFLCVVLIIAIVFTGATVTSPADSQNGGPKRNSPP